MLTPQPHGGALRTGGTKGASGRRPQAIRKRALAILAKNLDVLDHIASGATAEFVEDGKLVIVTPRPAERIAAVKLAGELGMGERVQVSDVRARLREQILIIREQETWTQAELLARLGAVWR